MKKIIYIFLFLVNILTFGQKTPEDFGFRHIVYKYRTDNVDILIKSKSGDEEVQKPIFFFSPGSLPQPLIKYFDNNGHDGVFPFNPDILTDKYHLVIVNKPYIPVIADVSTLSPNFMYVDSTGRPPKEYLDRNLLSYYTKRNIAILKYLLKQKWVSKTQLVVAGHSEGSSIGAKMATEYKKITHLIFSGGNPMGKIMDMIGGQREIEADTDNERFGNAVIKFWEEIVENKSSIVAARPQGDTYKNLFEFSYPPPIRHLEKLKIPVLVSYGTKDVGAPFNDFLHVEMIRQKKRNFTFKAYIGTEHNYFPLTEDNQPNYDIYNWNKVAYDWLEWLMKINNNSK